MSYCRFSTDYFECDVYVYEDVAGGWTTHVAGRKQVATVPQHIKATLPPTGDSDWPTAYMAQKAAIDAWIQTQPHEVILGKTTEGKEVPMYFLTKYEPLTFEGAGQTFSHGSPKECAEFLLELRARGARVPQSAIEALLEESEEE